jgi:hypothetical protein
MKAIFARSAADFEGALEVLSKSFPMNYFELRTSIGFLLDNAPGMRCLIVKDSNSTVIGAMLLFDRILNYFSVDCNVTGLSYFGIYPEHQSGSVAQALKKSLFEYLNSTSDISIGIARKVMDSYWYPYGYRGFTNFCQVSFPIRVFPKAKSGLTSTPPKAIDLPVISEICLDSSKNILGTLKRDLPLWAYYLKRCSVSSATFEVLSMGQEIVGYMISKNNMVLEISIKHEFMHEAPKYIAEVFRRKNYEEVIFEIGREHPIITYLSKYEHAISARYVWKGGHIVKIHSILAFLKKVINVLEQRVVETNLKDFDFVCASIRFIYRNDSLRIEASEEENNIYFLKEEWSKLIFGVLECKYLVGFKADNHRFILNTIFPKKSPQIPWLDQI